MKLKTLFQYEPKKEYNFTIQSTQNIPNDPQKDDKTKQVVYNSLEQNLKYLRTEYNELINSDIIFREFSLIAKNKEYKALLIYIDGMDKKML